MTEQKQNPFSKKEEDSGIKNDGRSSEADTTKAAVEAERQVTPSEPKHAAESPTSTDAEKKATTQSTRRTTAKTGLSDLNDADLVDQETGKALPLSAQTENLQGTVVNNSGRAILKIAVRGYIGEEPVTILAENAGEFGELIAALEKAAVQQKKDQKAKK